MSKHYLSILSFATLICMMLFGAVSCKKDDGGQTHNPTGADFFIDVDFLPKSETNGEAEPRLLVNFNNEAVMIELRRPSTSTPMESVLFLFPDNKATMMCGNDTLMICADYDMETHTPSHDVLLVTPMDDNALLLTKCFMDWNTNTMTKHDMMVLPLDGNSKNHSKRGGSDDDMRQFFFNNFIKPLAENLDQLEGFYNVFGIPQGIVVSYIRVMITTMSSVILFSDDPEAFLDAMEFAVTMETANAAQEGVLQLFPQDPSEMASKILSVMGWFSSGGHGTVDEGTGGQELSVSVFFAQSSNMIQTSAQIGTLDPVFIVSLNVSNVAETSARLMGSYRIVSNSNMMPVEMGYIYKVSGGAQHTEYDMYFNGITLSGLHKATKYTAYAYVKSVMGDKVLSPGVTFWTLGFEAFPSSLTFPTEGDTKNVALSYSEEDITSWEITSKPSWCAISINELGLLAVTVDASTETRSGTIVITGHSQALGNLTEKITVIQFGASNWDGTSWSFSGIITTNGIAGTESSPVNNSILIVNSVFNNDISFDLAQVLDPISSGYSENYELDGNGNLIYNATGSLGYNANINCRVIFVRTGPSSATAEINMQESLPEGFGQTFSGVLQGILINTP